MVDMIKVFYGEKGMGKSKMMIDLANEHAVQRKGDVVFIDDSNDLMYKLKHVIRFTNVAEYPVQGSEPFFAFICGIISQNYDIEGIFIDGLTYIVKESIGTMGVFFKNIEALAKKYNIHFIFSINGKQEDMPEFLKPYI
jgi:hypothetical protein